MSARVRLDCAEQVATQVAGPSLAMNVASCFDCWTTGVFGQDET